jgi:hypothetical protein
LINNFLVVRKRKRTEVESLGINADAMVDAASTSSTLESMFSLLLLFRIYSLFNFCCPAPPGKKRSKKELLGFRQSSRSTAKAQRERIAETTKQVFFLSPFPALPFSRILFSSLFFRPW